MNRHARAVSHNGKREDDDNNSALYEATGDTRRSKGRRDNLVYDLTPEEIAIIVASSEKG